MKISSKLFRKIEYAAQARVNEIEHHWEEVGSPTWDHLWNDALELVDIFQILAELDKHSD